MENKWSGAVADAGWGNSGVGCATKCCNPYKWKATIEKRLTEIQEANDAEKVVNTAEHKEKAQAVERQRRSCTR